jgi:hypothetical protein
LTSEPKCVWSRSRISRYCCFASSTCPSSESNRARSARRSSESHSAAESRRDSIDTRAASRFRRVTTRRSRQGTVGSLSMRTLRARGEGRRGGAARRYFVGFALRAKVSLRTAAVDGKMLRKTKATRLDGRGPKLSRQVRCGDWPPPQNCLDLAARFGEYPDFDWRDGPRRAWHSGPSRDACGAAE